LVTIDRIKLYSPVGLRLVDEFTGVAPLGWTGALLDIRDPNGNWRETSIQPVRTPSGVVSYPGLGRSINVAGQPRHYRVRIQAQFYLPHYMVRNAGFEFLAYPYNDTNPPVHFAELAEALLLIPAPAYPFPSHVPVLRGAVVDASDKAVQNTLVSQGSVERVLTDERGVYALPLRWVSEGAPTPIDAVDERTGRHGSITIQLPDALGKPKNFNQVRAKRWPNT
jgi:hypothetical protein